MKKTGKKINIKIKDKKYLMTVILLAFIFTGFGKVLFFSGEAAVTTIPTLFINDRPFDYYQKFPLEFVDGVEYVPRLFFQFFPGMEWDDTNSPKDYYFYFFYDKKNLLSFDVKNGVAYDDSKNRTIDLKVVILNQAYYVPAYEVANILGIKIEIDKKYNVVRISNHNASKTMEEIINSYIEKSTTTEKTIKSTEPVSTQTEKMTTQTTVIAEVTEHTTAQKPTDTVNFTTAHVPPVTTAFPTVTTTEPLVITTTAPPTTTEDKTPRENYIVFEEVVNTSYSNNAYNNQEEKIYTKNKKLNDILDVLDKNNYKSTFFFRSDEIKESVDIIAEVYSHGHNIGIKLKDGIEDFSSYDSIKNELDKANKIIYAVLKKTSEMYILSDDFYGDEFMRSVIELNLKKSGYYLCRSNNADEDEHKFSHFLSQSDILSVIRKKTINTFLFDLNNDIPSNVELIFDVAKEKNFVTVKELNISNITK